MRASNIAGTASHAEPTIVTVSGSDVKPNFNDAIPASNFVPVSNYAGPASGIEIDTTTVDPVSEYNYNPACNATVPALSLSPTSPVPPPTSSPSMLLLVSPP